MRLTKLRVECPTDWINNPIDGEINRTFFTNFVVELCEFGIPVSLVRGRYGADQCPRFPDEDEMVFAYHGYATDDDVINDQVFYLKEAPVRPLYSIETGGYSGWSLITRKPEKFRRAIENIPLEKAKHIIENYKNRFHQTGDSKYPQHHLDDWLEKDYVFFPLQVQTDPVASLSRLKAIDLVKKAAETAEKTKTKLVLKLHPFNDSVELENLVTQLCATNKFVIVTDANIHQLNEHARSVMSVNSGSSFEARIMRAHVWNSGTSEWWGAVNHIETLDDVEKVFSKDQPKISAYQLKHIAFLLDKYWIDGTNRAQIRDRLLEIFSPYEQPAATENAESPSAEQNRLNLINQLLKTQSELRSLRKELSRCVETMNDQAVKISRYDKLKSLFDALAPAETTRRQFARFLIIKLSKLFAK
jgi:hypothetical protein